MSRPLVISIEGIDGSGTTSVTDAAQKRFKNVKTTAEPAEQFYTGEATRKAINDNKTHPMTDFHFFIGDRAYHIENTIKPALKAGRTVITDRYLHSTFAYQQVNLDGVVDEPEEYIHESMKEWVLYPNLTILLDVPADVAAERTSDDDKYEVSSFQKKVRQNYLDLAEDDPSVITVDASQPKEKVMMESLTIIEEAMTQMHEEDGW